MAHPYHSYREYQASHRRVGTRLKGEPEGATKHATGKAFSNVTSKTAAASHDSKVEGKSAPKRFARGGKVKHSDEAQDRKLITKMMAEHERKEGEKGYARGGKVKGSTTNIAIVLPGGKGEAPDMPMPPMAGGPPPMPGPGGPPGMPPGLPPGMPMRASGGRVKKADGGDIKPLQITPDIKARFERRLQNAESDEATRRIVNQAAKYGVDWTHMLSKATGGSVSGESTKETIAKSASRAKANSYFRGGAATGVGREEKAAHMRQKRK